MVEAHADHRIDEDDDDPQAADVGDRRQRVQQRLHEEDDLAGGSKDRVRGIYEAKKKRIETSWSVRIKLPVITRSFGKNTHSLRIFTRSLVKNTHSLSHF